MVGENLLSRTVAVGENLLSRTEDRARYPASTKHRVLARSLNRGILEPIAPGGRKKPEWRGYFRCDPLIPDLPGGRYRKRDAAAKRRSPAVAGQGGGGSTGGVFAAAGQWRPGPMPTPIQSSEETRHATLPAHRRRRLPGFLRPARIPGAGSKSRPAGPESAQLRPSQPRIDHKP